MRISSTILITFLIFSALTVSGQRVRKPSDKELQGKIQTLAKENKSLKRSLVSTSNRIEIQARQIEELKEKIAGTEKQLTEKANAFEDKIADNSRAADQKFSDLDSSLTRSKLFWLITAGFVGLLSIGLFLWIKRRNGTDYSALASQIQQTQGSLKEESVRLDNKLAEILDLQLKAAVEKGSHNSEIDHSLVLNIANEINRMRMNILHMDTGVRGVTQLTRVLSNMTDVIKREGYEIIDLLGKPYDIGMNLIGTMEPDPKLKAGEETIKRIIKPQINHNNIMIQAAEVVIGYGE